MPTCVFCRLIDGFDKIDFIDKNEDFVIFVPLKPYVPGHVLVVPTTHVRNASHDPYLAGKTAEAAAEYGRRVYGTGFNILTSDGAMATQSINHLHWHVLPRSNRDGLNMDWPWNRPEFSGED